MFRIRIQGDIFLSWKNESLADRRWGFFHEPFCKNCPCMNVPHKNPTLFNIIF
jgi:hypothetical protein